MVYEPLYHDQQKWRAYAWFFGPFCFYCSLVLIFWGVFNKTIIPLALVGYEMIIANSALRASLAIYRLISNARSWNNKQLLDEVFVISRIIKFEVRVISRSRRLRLITLTETLIILDITKTESDNCFIIHWKQKLGSRVSASSQTTSNASRAKLTWLPFEIMHCGHTWHDYSWPWHDYPWPWHDYCIICSYDVTGADFENSLYAFGQWEKS